MRTTLALLLAVDLLALTTATPSLGQSEDQLTELRKEVEKLKEGQKALQRDLQDIKVLLRSRLAPAVGPGPQEALTQPVVLNIDGASFLGSQSARVTVVEFSDFQCPFCARHSQQTLPAIEEYIDSGKVKYVLRDFPIAALHPQAEKSHEAAHCAGEQGKYWPMHDRLLSNIHGQDTPELTAHARALGLDSRKFEQCLASGRYGATVRKAVEEGQRAGVRGTPTFFVGATGDGRTMQATRMLRGAQPYERLKGAIDLVLADGGKS